MVVASERSLSPVTVLERAEVSLHILPSARYHPSMSPKPQTNGIVKRPTGRPTIFTPQIADEIARRYAAGEAMHAIARDPAMPCLSTIKLWGAEDREGFSAIIASARESKAAWHADSAREVLDDVDLEELEDPRLANATVSLADKRSGVHRWLAERLDSDTWGDPRARAEAAAGTALARVVFGALSAGAQRPAIPADATAEVVKDADVVQPDDDSSAAGIEE